MLHLENGCHAAAAMPEFGSYAGKTNCPVFVPHRYHQWRQIQSMASCSFGNVAWTGKLVLVGLHTECSQKRPSKASHKAPCLRHQFRHIFCSISQIQSHQSMI